MKYGIEADWMLLDTCNYRCSYCFFPPEQLSSKLRIHATPSEWRSAFDQTGNVWLLHLTGGEPGLYPDFVELCAALSERHYLSFNSNLTSVSLAHFADRIDPARIQSINAGFHLEERARKAGTAAFLKNAALLRTKGFPIFVSLVATPEALARAEQAVRALEPLGLYPIPKLLRGLLLGRQYPDAYSETDKLRFRELAVKARDVYEPVLARTSERPSIDMLLDDRYLDGLPSFAGMSCDAGFKFVSLKSNGDAFRCSDKRPLGNLLEGTFLRGSGPSPCDTVHCYYFCNKYTRPKHSREAEAVGNAPTHAPIRRGLTDPLGAHAHTPIEPPRRAS